LLFYHVWSSKLFEREIRLYFENAREIITVPLTVLIHYYHRPCTKVFDYYQLLYIAVLAIIGLFRGVNKNI